MVSLPNAFVTLLTDSSYLPGALVLLHSLQDLHPAPRSFKIVCLVTPETVDARTIGVLRNAGYDLVIGVEPIASGASGQQGLQLMGRPDLDIALTKLHIFRLQTLFSTIVYLDADTLPLRPLDQLFETTSPHRFSASPDIGWPDCFNSGVMVIRPQLSDFTALQATLAAHADSGNGNGSFDGADQGLLNEYFSEEGPGGAWNRLPFTYNVTPSAAYQYAPAYKHYAHKINLIHFIGPNKPWKWLSSRQARSSPPPNTAFDYESLLDRWFAVYDQHVRPTAAHEPNLAKRFQVPEHVAIWNSPGAAQVPDRLDLDSLKEAIQQGVTALKPGQYTSLPLEGRVDLIRPKPEPRAAISTNTGTNSANQPGEPAAPPQNNHAERPTQPHSHSQPVHHRPAPQQHGIWDASRYSPPRHSQPEMTIQMHAVYEPAWDQPVKSHATYFQTLPQNVYTEYPSIPQNVQSNDWYHTFTSTKPSQANVQRVFPWEDKEKSRAAATRAFPQADTPTSKRSVAPKPKPVIIPATTSSDNSRPSFSDSVASYRNAWDNVASIDRYAKRLTALGIGTERLSQSTIRTAGPSPGAPATPTSQRHRRGNNPKAGSDTSRDGDDEAEHVQRSHYPSNALYRDGFAQTDRPRVTHASAQASPETSPTFKAVDAPNVKRRSAGSDPRSRGHGRQSSNALFPTYNFSQPPVGTQGSSSVRGRVWNPSTDLDAMRQDSQKVLSRFVTSGSSSTT
ncbi:Glycogenin-1 [Vanrija pseudolonga]|uniref:Glycogenin-1 n=1 Tax=Vanrija pseudolonga TaxID=143232 RepID=A0AAF0YA29_9TREE|nr:Glycogenin-1 [Vanrija pseudolonga]